ncbi:MAG TPA: POTRA domain-containing protein [Segetibacter sp.]
MFISGKFIPFLLLFCAGSILQLKAQNSVQINSNTISEASAETDTSQVLLIIGDVRVTGYKKTKLYIIQREIPFKTGEYILRNDLEKKIELCRQQLMNTSLFVDVEVKIAREQDNIVFIDIVTKERWYLFPVPYFKIVDRNLNQWLVEHNASLQRINYGLKFTQYNVSGRNDKFNLWLVNGYTQQFTIRYDNPFIDKKLKSGINFGVSYSRNREINYITDPDSSKQKFYKDENRFLRRNFHVELGYSYRPAIRTRHIFRISYTDDKVDDTVLALNPSYFKEEVNNVKYPSFSYHLYYFNVDYIPYPLKGFMGDAHFYKRDIGKKNNIWELGGKGTYTIPVFEKSYMQFQAAGVIKLPFKQPYYAQGMFGGSDFFMRGLEYHVIDGVAGGFARATAIRQLLSWNIKSPIKSKSHDKIPLRIYGKAYSDAGYSYNPNENKSMLNNKLLKTWGMGVDIVTFYDIVLKIEYSFNQLGKSGLFIHSKSDF